MVRVWRKNSVRYVRAAPCEQLASYVVASCVVCDCSVSANPANRLLSLAGSLYLSTPFFALPRFTSV